MNYTNLLPQIINRIKLPLLLLVFGIHWTAPAQVTTNPPTDGVVLKVLNREVMTFRANLGTYSPEQRATAAEARIQRAIPKSGSPRVDSQVVDGNAELRVHGQTVFFTFS